MLPTRSSFAGTTTPSTSSNGSPTPSSTKTTGIVVGSVLGTGLLTIGALLFVLQHYWQKIKKNTASTSQEIVEAPADNGIKELDGARQFELDIESESRYELHE